MSAAIMLQFISKIKIFMCSFFKTKLFTYLTIRFNNLSEKHSGINCCCKPSDFKGIATFCVGIMTNWLGGVQTFLGFGISRVEMYKKKLPSNPQK